VRLFGRDYPDWLRKAGFEITEYIPSAHFSKGQIERFRLMEKEVLYIAQKPH
jgi:hypothetical protein